MARIFAFHIVLTMRSNRIAAFSCVGMFRYLLDNQFSIFLLAFLFIPLETGQNHIGENTERDQTPRYGEDWGEKYPTCDGDKQSPININSKKTKKLASSKTFEFSKAYKNFPDRMHLAIKNDSLHLGFDFGKKSLPNVRGTGLKGIYKLNHVVFRWGEYSRGTEHSIDGNVRSLEVQLVHINSKHSNFEESLNQDDGVLIYSSLYKLQNNEGAPGIELVSINIPKYATYSDKKKFQIHTFPISWLMSSTDSYFVYEGSITYPPCSEVVTWMISSRSPNVTSRQLRRFRKLYKKHKELRNNIRDQQRWNGRTIYRRNVREGS